MMNRAVTKHEEPLESIDPEKIILDAEGKYPRKIIIREKGGLRKEYSLIKTQSGNYLLNR